VLTVPNEHFENLAYKDSFCNNCKTNSSCVKWICQVGL